MFYSDPLIRRFGPGARKHRAFTLVELLVVIAVVGLLVSLLLPAVQAAREAGRRTQCLNNLKQIGLALHHYHDLNKRLPSGWIAKGSDDGKTGWGWAAHLLLFMEHKELYDATAFDLPVGDPANAQTRQHVIPTFVCPSDIQTRTFPLGGLTVARGNYVGVFGTREIEDQPGDGDGTFFRNSVLSFADILDGLSNTIMVGERNSMLGKSTWVGIVPGADRPLARIVGTTDHAPNAPTGHFEDFSSHHANGVHFLLGDGSVRRIDESIDMKVYRALATRAESDP